MKIFRFYILFALLLTTSGLMQAQGTKEYYPLIPESGEKQWEMRFGYYYGVSRYEIGILGDEIEYEGQTYRELTIKYDDINYTVRFGLMREEGKKVYLRRYSTAIPNIMEEELYYDFNLQVGDLFEVGYGDELEYIQLMAIEEVVLEDGSVRNKYVFNMGWEDDFPEVWIEGVGSLSGISWRYIPGWTASGFAKLKCYFENDGLVWTSGECWDDVEENSPSTDLGSITIYPIPFSDIVRIEGIKPVEVLVYNALGQLIKETKENVIDLSEQQTGTYIVKVITPSGVVTKQIIKK